MHTLQRAALVLMLPPIAWLATACNQTEAPTGPQSPEVSMGLSGSNTLWVNDDGVPMPTGTSCNNPNYNRIQDAVAAASAGYRINVCPGTYIEQVTIPAYKDNLRLRSVKRWEAIIQAPPVMPDLYKAIVRVNGATGVEILAFTITGPGGGGCNSLRYGVRVDEGGSADILGNHITDIRDAPPPPTVSGCQNGVAVQVGRRFVPPLGDPTPEDITTGSAKIMGNVIENYQKNGTTVDNNGSHAEIAHNRILGVGPTPTIAQNGAQASRGATAEIQHNFIAKNIYTGPEDAASTGVLLFQSGQVLTDHNTATSNDVDIYMYQASAGSLTTHNRARASTYDGIIIQAGSGNQVVHNKSEENTGPGIGLYDAQSNTVDDNKVEDNDDSGILLGDQDGFSPANDNTVGNNQVRENGTAGLDLTDGIRINTGSMGNTVHDNHLRDNVTHDCHDNSTGNVWDDNHGETSFPMGLCSKDPDDAAFETSTVYGWDPNYPWSTAFDIPVDYDWAAAYATIDTDALLKLLPGVPTTGVRRVHPQP
jgi:parallel beta-helix repeat protein